MKNLLLLLSFVVLLFSCENVEDNSPAFQANVDNIFFKSDGITVDRANHVIDMVGIKEGEKITLHFALDENDLTLLGDGTDDYATFEDKFGNIYTTGEGATGEILLTGRSGGNRVISGSFNFTAILEGVDTLRVNNGVFYEVRTID